VSKNAAVMILTDDNFATIVKAVEYGRAIYSNLFNYIRFQMSALVAFIASYLMAAVFLILGGVPFTPLVVLWVNFLVQVPIAVALGFDKPARDLMTHRPRPLRQPILSRGQWVRVTFIGLLMAVGTIAVEAVNDDDPITAATMGFVVFSLFNISLALTSHSETSTVFNRDIFADRRQLALTGLALLFTILPTWLDFLQRFLDLTELSGNMWLVAIGLSLALILVDELIKVFLRRQQPALEAAQPEPAMAASA
jgi:Ca2+-transporting ATPase